MTSYIPISEILNFKAAYKVVSKFLAAFSYKDVIFCSFLSLTQSHFLGYTPTNSFVDKNEHLSRLDHDWDQAKGFDCVLFRSTGNFYRQDCYNGG